MSEEEFQWQVDVTYRRSQDPKTRGNKKEDDNASNRDRQLEGWERCINKREWGRSEIQLNEFVR